MPRCLFHLACLILLSLLDATGARAQEPLASATRESHRRTPGLLVRLEGQESSQPLSVRSLSIDVEVNDTLATTTLDIVYHNATDRVLEGQFILPLPADTLPVRFAMDVNGTLREAVVVERHRARAVFEEIVRRNVDPGLLEWAEGNAFRARVFPIPARGDKRIVVAYEQSLSTSEAGIHSLRVPLEYEQSLDEFRVRVTVSGAPGTRVTSSHGPGLVIAAGTNRARFEIVGKNALADRDLVLHVTPPQPAPVVLLEENDHGVFFLARVPRPGGERARRKPPTRVGVLWDASRSRESLSSSEHACAILDAYLATAADIEVTLQVFSDQVWFTETYASNAEGLSALRARIEGVRPDGGTSYASVDFHGLARQVDEILIFTDGLDTLEQQLPEGLDVPVFALNRTRRGSPATLRQLAASGAVIETWRVPVEEVLVRLRDTRCRPVGIECDGQRLADAEFPAVTGDGWLEVRGRLPATASPPESLTLLVSDGRGAVERIPVPLASARTVDGGVLERAWAQARVARLMVRRMSNREEISAIGARHGLVTAFTSLLVLESVEDHIRYRIPPPPDWLAAYEAGLAKAEADQRASREERLVSLALRWQERKDFCLREYEFPLPRAPGQGDSVAAERASSLRREGGSSSSIVLGGSDEEESAGASSSIMLDDTDDEFYAAEIASSFAFGFDEGNDYPNFPAPRLSLGSTFVAEGEGHGDPMLPAQPGLRVEPWQHDGPHLRALREAGASAYEKYLELARQFGATPAFYLDIADYFLEERQEPVLGLRILSNVAEVAHSDARLLRMLAHRYAESGAVERAEALLRRVREMRPEEPQSHRDLALVLAAGGEYAEAIRLLEQVVMGRWDTRFAGISLIALGELNTIVHAARKQAEGAEEPSAYHTLPPSLITPLESDIRIVMSWDTDAVDIDLWVTEPSGERVGYSHKRSQIGGRYARDFTGGYGPEAYVLHKAMPGTYAVQIHFYGDSRSSLRGATTVRVELIRNYGRREEQRTVVTRRLRSSKEWLSVGELEF